MSNFKIALTAVFAICIVIGIGLFALSKGSSSLAQASNLVIWGTLAPEVFDIAYKNSSLPTNKLIKVVYLKKDTLTFNQDFVEALANGVGPDIVILRDDNVYKNRGKLFPIPYASYSQRNFKDTFIPAGEIFLYPDGILAMPFIVDPLVMYWNRDLFTNALVVEPPKYWDQVYPIVDKITHRDNTGSILQSAVGLGEWSNITNAKEIFTMFLLQAGTPIIERGSNGLVTSVLNLQFNYPIAPSYSALNFYTQFSNPTSPTYSWNRSLPSSLNLFLSGNLAIYLGFASEISSIQQKNSNLNFDVTMMPQIRDTTKKTVFAHIYSLSIVKQSKQIAGAFTAINALTEAIALGSLESLTNLPPVRRDLLGTRPTNPFREVFYDSALLSRSWIDPDPIASGKTFRDIIETVTSGKERPSEALNQANNELNTQLK